MKLECPHKWETTLWHRATTVALLGYAVPKADALEDFAKFLTPLPAGSEFQPFLLRLHACAEQSRGGSMPSRMTLELTARLVHTGVMLVQWSCVKHPEPGNNHHLWTPVREIGDNRLVWRIEWKWTPRVMVSRTPNQSVTIAKRDVAEILRDLCFWQSLATSMSLAELTQKITPYFSVYFFARNPFMMATISNGIAWSIQLTPNWRRGAQKQAHWLLRAIMPFRIRTMSIFPLPWQSCLLRLHSCRNGAFRPNQSGSTSCIYQRCLEK